MGLWRTGAFFALTAVELAVLGIHFGMRGVDLGLKFVATACERGLDALDALDEGERS